MTTAIRRRRRSAVVATVLSAVLGLVLSACSSGPSQVNAAAIVGGKTIGVDRVQELVEAAVRAEPAARALADQRKLDMISRAVLRQLVLHELVGAYAAKEGITVEPADVSRLAGQLTESLQPLPEDGSVPPESIVDQAVTKAFPVEEVARDYLLLSEIGKSQASSLSVTFDYVLITPGAEEATGSLREKAVEKARQLAEGPEEATRVIDADIAAGLQAAKGETITPSQASDIAGTAIFGTGAGNVVAFQPSQENAAWVVAVIRERDTAAKGDAAAADNPRLTTTMGPRMLQDSVDEVGVRISPRYGVWDLVSMTVAPNENETAGVIVPVKGARQP